MPATMFSTLESNWGHSPRRGRATLASFAVQAFGLSLLIAISLLWVERPPQVHWLHVPMLPAIAPTGIEPVRGHHSSPPGSRVVTIGSQRIAPRSL